MKKILTFIITLGTVLNFSYAQSDTITTKSGLKYIVVKEGKGKKAEDGKAVEVHYTGWLTNGKKFDSSRDRGEPIEFTLGEGQVIKGWDEGIALMRIGGKMRLIIPPELAYGSRQVGDIISPNSTLIFDVELMSVRKPLKPIADTLLSIILDKDVKTAIEVYHDLKDNYEDDYNFKESQLNMLGYELMQGGRLKDAIEIFKLNVEQFPESFNVYDSLGEGYMLDGNTKLAIKNYEKSIEINPDNENGKKMLKKLKEKE
jgi:hypothetical protein